MGILRPVRDHDVERAGDGSSASGTPTSSGPTSTRPTTSSSPASSSPACSGTALRDADPDRLPFADVVAALRPPAYGFTDRDDDSVCVELSNRMRSVGILTVRNPARDDVPETIERELEFRVRAGLGHRRHPLRPPEHRDAGRPAPEVLPPARPDVTNPLPSRLAFIAKDESVLGYLDRVFCRVTLGAERPKMRDTAACAPWR